MLNVVTMSSKERKEETENGAKLKSLSILLADYQAKLKKYLLSVQYAVKNKMEVEAGVEHQIKFIVSTIKQLQYLIKHDYKRCLPFGEDEISYSYWWTSEDSITTKDIERDIVTDLATFKKGKIRVAKAEKAIGDSEVRIQLELPIGQSIWVKAQQKPIPSEKINLKQVTLKDGNIAWLSPSTLTKIQKFLANLPKS